MRWVVLMCLTALVAAGCSSGDVFTFAEDDLCDWVSEDEVTSFVRDAYAQSGIEWDGSVVAAEPGASAWDLPDSDYCQWEPSDGGHVIARGFPPSQFLGGIIEFPTLNETTPIGNYSEHPSVADYVIVGNAAFGRFGFWLEDSDEKLGLEVAFREGTTDEDWENMLFDVANSFLSEMGWIP